MTFPALANDGSVVNLLTGAELGAKLDLIAGNALPPATQPVSGTVNVAGTVPVSGQFYPATQPVSIASPLAVTGTFWQATQPVSGTVTVSGVSTAANQATMITSLGLVSTAAAQTTGNASLASIDTKATANNTKLDSVITLLSATDPSLISSGTKRAVANSFTRPANATAYASGQLMANSTAFGSVVPLEFLLAGRVNGGKGTITAASVRSQSVRGGADIIRLHVFRDPPVITVGGDGTAIATVAAIRAAIHLGSFDVTLDQIGTDGTLGHAAPRNRGSIVFECGAATTSLYGLLEARSAVSGVSGEMLGASLELIQD